MKQVEVSAAVIIKDKKVLVTARGYGDNKGKFEFPGGKLEPNEDPKTCLKREIKEELNAEIEILAHLKTIIYDYPNFRLKMHVFMCKLVNDKYELLEHLEAKYVDLKELREVDFLPADFELIEPIIDYINSEI